MEVIILFSWNIGSYSLFTENILSMNLTKFCNILPMFFFFLSIYNTHILSKNNPYILFPYHIYVDFRTIIFFLENKKKYTLIFL